MRWSTNSRHPRRTRHRRRNVLPTLALAVITFGALLVTADPAQACSCIPSDIRTRLSKADAGVVFFVKAAANGEYVVEIRQVAKGPFEVGDEIVVFAGVPSKPCSTGFPVGATRAMLLNENDGRWSVGSCSFTTAKALEKGVSPLPNPQPGPAAMLLGGQFGPGNSIVALAGDGTLRGYGQGDEPIIEILMCPGNERFLARTDRGNLELRSTHDLSVLDSPTPNLEGQIVRRIWCLDASGSRYLVFTNDGTKPKLLAFDGTSTREVWVGSGLVYSVTVHEESLNAFLSGRDLLRVDITAATVETLPFEGGGLNGLTASADGRFLAGIRWNRVGHLDTLTVQVVDSQSPAAAVTINLDDGLAGIENTSLIWFADGRLGIHTVSSPLDIYDQRFEPTASTDRLPGTLIASFDDTAISVLGDDMYQTTVDTREVAHLAELPPSTVRTAVVFNEEMPVDTFDPTGEDDTIGSEQVQVTPARTPSGEVHTGRVEQELQAPTVRGGLWSLAWIKDAIVRLVIGLFRR